MSLAEAIQQAEFINPQHREGLNKVLNNEFPGEVEKWLYSRNVDYNTLSQGDIINQIPVCFINKKGSVIKGVDTVALISNVCDMQPTRRDYISVSPIIPLDDVAAEISSNILTDIRNYKIIRFFYLPSNGTFPESCIDLSRVVSISSFYINQLKEHQSSQFILSFSQYGHYLFLIKLTHHLARLEK